MTRRIKILILLSCLFPWLQAMADPIVTSVGSGSTCPGDEVVIPVTVSNCNGVAAISLALNFDNTKVSYQGHQNLNSAVSTMLVNASGGTVYMTWANMSAVDVENGTLVELRFTGITGSTGLNWNTTLCEYSDATGTVIQSNYNNGSVSVYTVPNITSNPSNRNLVEGQSTNFDVGASGSGLSYQWQIKTPFDDDWENLTNGGHHSNVYNWRLNVNNVTLDMNGNQYRCVVSGTCPSPVTSEAATLTVEPYIPPIPTIVTSTGSVSICADQAFSIPVTVTNCNNVGAISLALNFNQNMVTYLGYENANSQLGNGTMRVNASRGTVYFTWASSNQTLEIGNGELISFVFKSVSGNSSLTWNTSQCEYSNLSGEALPTAFNGSNLNIYFPPSISSHPSDRTVTEGNNTNFSISASGQGLSYRWQMSQDQGISWENLSNGGHYSNVTSSTLYVNNVQMAMEGLRYRCVVNGTCEPSVTSNYGTLHVVQAPPPTIVTTAGSLNTCSQTEFGIPISVTNCNNVGAISLVLSYNTNVLTFAGYEGLNPALSDGQVQVNAANGKVYIAWASATGANVGNSNLITINFTALSGTSGLNWNTSLCEYANPQGAALPTSYSNGNVSVGDLSFTITQQPASQTITMEESTTFTVATSGPTSGYQWQVSQNGGASWSNISAGGHYANPTTTTLSVNNVTLEMNGYRYRCVISGSCGVQYTTNVILTVQLPVNYHEIVLSADPAEGGTVSGGGAHEEGQPCTVTATPATGYDFINWTENGTEVSTEASYTFTVTEDRNLVAHFALQELTIVTTVVPEGSGTVTGAGTYLYGTNVLLTAIPAEGFVFDNWTENGEVVSTNQSISFTAQTDRDLTANFSVLQLNITAIAVPASNGTVEGAGTYAYGTTVTLTAIAAEGFELANWTENDTIVSTETTLSFVAQTDRNLVANFIIQTLHITAETDPEGSGTITGTGDYNYGDPVVLTATPMGQFEFYNWTENGEEVSTQPTLSFTAYNHRHLVAHFITTITIAATAQPEEGGTISGAGTYNFTDPVTLTATANTGYAFVNWTENDTVFSTETTISFTAYVNRTFVANFEMITHHISVEANIGAGGTVSGGGDYQEGTLATVSAQPNANFDFVRWSENGASVSTNRNYSFTVWAPRNLVAEFEMQITDTAAYTCDAFEWHGHTYTSNGVYYDTLTSYLGIDSIVALNLTIYPSYHYEYTETECGSYLWEDSLYTESGDYTREFQSIYGCDSIRTLHLTILPIRPLGNFTYMSPANNYVVRYTDREFYWDLIPNANLYDFYFWQGDGGKPNTPTVSNLTSTTYHVYNLTHGTTYHWCVVAKNECQESESDIRTFTCQLDPSMTVIPNGMMDFGEVSLGQSRTKTISVSGVALPEDISYSYLDNGWGVDAAFFTVNPTGWSPTNGGLLNVTFTPEPTQLYYHTGIRIASGTFADTIYFMGSVANRYVFTTNVDGEVFSANDTIDIHGHVEDLLGNAVQGMGVTVYMTVMGSRITMPTVSDANGNYTVHYIPAYSESGYYQVGSCASGDYTTTVHDAFDIPGMGRVSNDFIIWNPYQYDTVSGVIEIRNRSRIPISNIQINNFGLPSGCVVNISGVTELGPLEVGQLHYTVTGNTVSTGNSYEEIPFLLTSDEGVTMNMTCYYYCSPRRGALDIYPPSVATTMQRNAQKMLSFQITNHGNGETGPITVSLPNVEWMSVVNNATMESLQVGESCAFSVMLFPDENLDLIQYTGNIAVNCANGNGTLIPYCVEAIADTTTRLTVDVTDDVTYNTNGGFGPHLAGATVSLTGFYSPGTVFAQGMTDENGLFVVENVPEGWYHLSVSAESHYGHSSIIYIDGGQSTRESHQEVYLQYKAIDYSWVVVPTEVEDEYEFVLECYVETNVPVPVVTIQGPSSFDPMEYGDTIHFNMTVRNDGLVDALDVQITMPTEFSEYKFSSLYDFIDTLHANTMVTVPCTLTRVPGDGRDSDDCVEGSTKLRHFYYCNWQKKWVEFLFPIRVTTHCPQTHVPNEINFHHLAYEYGFLEWPTGSSGTYYPGGGGVGGGHPGSVQTDTLAPTAPNSTTNPITIPTNGEDCTPCWKVISTLAINVVSSVSGIPNDAFPTLYTCAINNFDLFEEFSFGRLVTRTWQFGRCVVLNCLDDAVANALGVGIIKNLVSTIKDAVQGFRDCFRAEDEPIDRDDPQVEVLYDELDQIGNVLEATTELIANLFGDEAWLYEPNLDDFMDNLFALVDTTTYTVSPQALAQLIETSELSNISDEQIESFVERWNRSVQYWDAGYKTEADLPEGYNPDFIQQVSAQMDQFDEVQEAVEAYGYSDMSEMLSHSLSGISAVSREHENDVCAGVTLQFSQTMMMTREAFEGTLRISNGHMTDPMENINVNIVIKDDDGVDRTDLFQINVKSLSQLTGVDGTGSIEAQTEGTVVFEMIPTIAAAPDTAQFYSFGGSFSFLDPFSGNELTYPLFPVRLQVNPSPNLHVDYFVSRHIISDDPLTDSIIEPTEPAEIAMMISNVGAGNANNVLLQSVQPQIVENQNGLLINFNIVETVMNGEIRSMGLTDIPFGTIESHTAGIAEWYFTSTLMARINHSTPRVVHNNSYGNPQLSLVTELNSHELIKAIRAYGSLEDGINDFFVNETTDFNHTPDKIYFSNGGTADVSKVIVANTEGILSDTNDVILLNVTPIAAGWNYACVDDPAQGLREIVSCTRDDGQEIPLSNVWLTFVTMLDEGAPIHENKLHIVDTLAVNQATTYTLVFAEALSNVRIFNGNVDVYWSNAENWEDNIMPQASDEVLINGICQLDEDATVTTLTIAEDQSLTILADRILTVTGTLTSAAASRLIIEEGGQLMHGNAGARATVQKAIAPYTTNDNGWYLISSPFAGGTDMTVVENLLSNDYDLYYYDEPTHYWINQETSENHFTTLFNGQGYLYANDQEVELGFAGELQSGTTTVSVLLSHTSGIELEGFNLVGNPYAHNVTSYASVNVADGCYQMNEALDDLIVGEISESNPLKPVEGFFVKATDAGASVTFNPNRGTMSGQRGSLRVEVVHDGKLLDRLIVKNEGEPLEKLSLKEQRTKLFAMQDRQEVAIVPCDGNEQPVGFKAAKDGTYTLNVNADGVEFDYLHLIDNLTGTDIDLLVEPSYTFEAKPSDYASRFRLVFSVSGDANGDNAPFAFINNGNIIIIGAEADAVLQIVDVTGRILVSRKGDAIHSVSTGGMAKGVYVLRLIDGDDVRTQKIVID